MSGIAGHGAAVHIENCGKTFPDGTQALAPASLDIVSGETLVLLGPSGCGKTTMLRIIAGLETPDAGGRVLFDKTDMTAVPIEQRHVGMVFQSYALFPNMTVAENIGYGLEDPRRRQGMRGRRASPRWWRSPISAGSKTAGSINYLAASVSASRWRARWPCAHGCCCWMSR